MASKTSNVVARVEPGIKEQAEAILEKLGISASAAINMFYRQIIYQNGLPFSLLIPDDVPKARDEMSKAEFDAAMIQGLAQAKDDQSDLEDEAFDRLSEKLNY